MKASEKKQVFNTAILTARKTLKGLTDKIEESEDIIKDIASRERAVKHREKLANTRFESAFQKEQALQKKKDELIQLKQQIIKGTKTIEVDDVL